jgi:DNA-binding MurR/RpiR family transcriptional regulator
MVKEHRTFPTRHSTPESAGCLIRIQSAIATFRPSERAIAEFILAHREQVVRMSISELARDANVGESTVIRFCRAAGLDGYQDLKIRLAQDLAQPAQYVHEAISFTDTVEELSQKIFHSSRVALNDTARSLDPKMVEVAAVAAVRARRIVLYGIASSFHSADKARLQMVRLGLMAEAFGDGHSQAHNAACLRTGDLAIGISHSGSTRDVVDALTLAQDAGATTVAITNYSPSPITKAADIVLLTASWETPFAGESVGSSISQFCVLDVLSAAIAIQLGESCVKEIEKTVLALKGKRY